MNEERSAETIFVVDNEPINCELLAARLGTQYRVLTFTNGRSALDAAQVEPPDLLLLDVVMPGMDGYQVLHAWKEQTETRAVPVIFVTGKDAVEEQTRGLGAGAEDYITKPYQMPLVLARAETQLKLKRKSDLLHRLASIDPMTEVGNRRRFDDVLDREWRRAARQEQLLSLAFVDVDHFKLYNDEYGHAAGDECLRKVARAMASVVRRAEDFLARYGGEEFAVILPGTDLRGAKHVGETLRKKVESLAIPHAGNPGIERVSVSIGVATVLAAPKVSPVTLVEAADAQLYRAKESGRNRVSPSSDSPERETATSLRLA